MGCRRVEGAKDGEGDVPCFAWKDKDCIHVVSGSCSPEEGSSCLHVTFSSPLAGIGLRESEVAASSPRVRGGRPAAGELLPLPRLPPPLQIRAWHYSGSEACIEVARGRILEHGVNVRPCASL